MPRVRINSPTGVGVGGGGGVRHLVYVSYVIVILNDLNGLLFTCTRRLNEDLELQQS